MVSTMMSARRGPLLARHRLRHAVPVRVVAIEGSLHQRRVGNGADDRLCIGVTVRAGDRQPDHGAGSLAVGGHRDGQRDARSAASIRRRPSSSSLTLIQTASRVDGNALAERPEHCISLTKRATILCAREFWRAQKFLRQPSLQRAAGSPDFVGDDSARVQDH